MKEEFKKVTEKNEIWNYDLVKKYAEANYKTEHPNSKEKFEFKKEGR